MKSPSRRFLSETWRWLSFRCRRCLILVAILVICGNFEAKAVMTGQSIPLSRVDDKFIEQITPLFKQSGYEALLRDHNGIYFTLFGDGFSETKFWLVRFQNSLCWEDRCLTFILSGEAPQQKIIFVALLPPRMWLGDTRNSFCEGCLGHGGVGFEDRRGRWLAIGLHKDFVVAPDNTLNWKPMDQGGRWTPLNSK